MQYFYDKLAPYYHLIYQDWEESIARQAQALQKVIHGQGGENLLTVLDACGIGTQSLGLARLGYKITASDLSVEAIKRIKHEAKVRKLLIHTTVTDMRQAYAHHRRTFDLVLSCDNSVPHLLSIADILTTFQQFYHCTAPGGLCLISVRDYAAIEGGVEIHPYPVQDYQGCRYLLLQVWEWQDQNYETTLYFIKHSKGKEPIVEASSAMYYAVSITTLSDLMKEPGFSDVHRVDGIFFQPVLVGHKPTS